MSILSAPPQAFPEFHDSAYPKAERSQIPDVITAMTALRGYIDDFTAAVELREFAVARMQGASPNLVAQSGKWAHLAAHGAALAAEEIDAAYKNLRAVVQKMPTLRDDIDWSEFKAAGGKLHRIFPDRSAVRGYVGHREDHRLKADFHGVDEEVIAAEGFIVSEGGNLFLGNLTGNKFEATKKGSIVQLEVSAATSAALYDFLAGLHAIFSTARDKARARLGLAPFPKR